MMCPDPLGSLLGSQLRRLPLQYFRMEAPIPGIALHSPLRLTQSDDLVQIGLMAQ